LEVIEQVEAEAVSAVVLVAVLAVKSLFLALGDHNAVAAFHWVWILSCDHHTLVFVLATRSVFIEANDILANSDSLLLSLELHHFFSKELDDIDVISLQFLHVVILEALMLGEICSFEFFDANLALNHNLWAILFDVFSQLGSCHLLVFSEIANIAAILGAFIILSMLLELSYGFPKDLSIGSLVALVRELAEVNAVSNNWIDLDKEVTFALAVGAHHGLVIGLCLIILISISVESSGLFVLSSEPLHSLCLSVGWGSVQLLTIFLHEFLDQVFILDGSWVFLKQKLAVLAEDFVASFALEWHVWELLAHCAADFVDQLLLELVLDLVELDVNSWDWLWAHDLLNSLFWNDKVKCFSRRVFRLESFWNDNLFLGLVESSWTSISHAHSDWGAVSPD
jgi:hypothetical protein